MKGKLSEIFYMARDFFKIITGVDYFHQPEKLGNFFQDGCSYYIDFKGKVNWTGKFIDNVPVLYIPSMDKYVFFPTMILQYGLGNIDMYFATKNISYLKNVTNVYNWIVKNIKEDYSFDNLSQEMDREFEYYSNNSAMTQGEALSFLIRVVKYNLVNGVSEDAAKLIKNIFENMILPLEQGGTIIQKGDEIYFCEYCRRNEYIVLNGWIFAIFGLFDYQQFFKDSISKRYLEKTLKTLEKNIEKFIMNNNWSYYDNKGRISSPIYQELHIHLMDALYRLTHMETFKNVKERLKKGNTWLNRIKYTLLKIRDKLKDTWRYSTMK